jgi:3-oxoacyl-[acyl-carrier-protein] synthase II
MSHIFVSGLGAVSPAGWDVAALRQALASGEPLPTQPLARPGWERPFKARLVPAPRERPAFLLHPRLRRTSPITHYAAAASLEAVAAFRHRSGPDCPLGLVVCLQSGCVQFSHRFFDEVIVDPATASPLLFPETVFAAPTSHVAALLQATPLVYTLMGDAADFLQGLALGAHWLAEGRVAACLIVAAEEPDWLLADALWHLEHAAVISAGAGAVCLSAAPEMSLGVELSLITDAFTYTASRNRELAAQAMRQQLPASSASELLCTGQGDSPRADAPEAAAWRDWTGPRLSPKRILGEGLMAAPAWQCVAACDALARRQYRAANVSVVGPNQMALGARFEETDS